jgi:hypothetical protein
MNSEIDKSNKLYFLTRLTPNANNWEKPSGKDGKCLQNEIYEAVHGFGWEEWLLNDLINESECKDGYCYGFIQAFNGKNKQFSSIDKLFLYTRKLENKRIINYYVGYIENIEILKKPSDFDYLIENCKRFCEKAKIDLKNCNIEDFQNELLKMCNEKKFYNVRFKPENVHFKMQYQHTIKPEKGQFRFALYDLKQHTNLANEILSIENNFNLKN